MRRIRRAALTLLACASACGLSLAWPVARAEDVPDHLTLLETLGRQAAGDMLDSLKLAPGTTIHIVPETPHPANWMISRILEQALVARGHRVLAPAFGKEGSEAQPGTPEPAPPGGAKPQPGRKKPGGGQQGSGQGAPPEDDDSSPAGPGEGTAGGTSGDSLATPAEPGDAAPGDSTGVSESSDPAEDEEPEGVAPAETGVTPALVGAGELESEFRLMLPEAGEVLSFRIVECGVSYPWVKRSLLIGPRQYGRIAAVRLWGSHLQEPGNRVAGSARGERIRIDSFPGWARAALEGQNYPFPLKAPETTSLKAVVEPAVVAGIVAGLIYLFYQNQK